MTADMPAESREAFEARYPRPASSSNATRVLVVCRCDYQEGPHWGWSWWFHNLEDGGLSPTDQLAEEAPRG